VNGPQADDLDWDANWERIAGMVDKCETMGKDARVLGWA
jgi:hypothetical protein